MFYAMSVLARTNGTLSQAKVKGRDRMKYETYLEMGNKEQQALINKWREDVGGGINFIKFRMWLAKQKEPKK